MASRHRAELDHQICGGRMKKDASSSLSLIVVYTSRMCITMKALESSRPLLRVTVVDRLRTRDADGAWKHTGTRRRRGVVRWWIAQHTVLDAVWAEGRCTGEQQAEEPLKSGMDEQSAKSGRNERRSNTHGVGRQSKEGKGRGEHSRKGGKQLLTGGIAATKSELQASG